MNNESSNISPVKDMFNENGFDLQLPTLVEGCDTQGKNFIEKTTLSYISHQGSSFWLNNLVTLEKELKLTIDLPPNLANEKDLKLVIKGKVIFIESPKDAAGKKRVSLKFGSKYIIKPDE